MLVRRGLYEMGYRYRLHDRRLPGRPDLVFTRRKAVVFVHGCFWHQHNAPGCKNSVAPMTRREWWQQKLEANRTRDAAATAALEADGWRCEVVWECDTRRDLAAVLKRLRDFLGPPGIER
jgi:DNA mismatch endonuclease (patch repair protein)